MANKMWGGRFETKPAEIMEEINASISFDRRLYAEDIRASQAHANMLFACGIIADEEAEALVSGLDTVREEIAAGKFKFRREYEDIHMAVEARLKELIGPVAGKLHTARSRNDQV
ncbi:MAG: lyase family protein, partial [Rhodomicrobium sp.]